MPVVSAFDYMDRHVYRRLSDLRTAFPAAYRPLSDLWNRPSDPRDSLLSLVGGGRRNNLFRFSIATRTVCDSCGNRRVNQDGHFFSVDGGTTQDCVDALLHRFTDPRTITCVSCARPALAKLEEVELPPVLLINARVTNVGGCKISGEVDPSLELRVGPLTYDLRAAVLKRRKHFISVALTEDGWCVFDDHRVSRLPAFERPGGCDLAFAFYTRRDGLLDRCLLGADGSITRCSQTTKAAAVVTTLIGADRSTTRSSSPNIPFTRSPSETTECPNTVTTITNRNILTPAPAVTPSPLADADIPLMAACLPTRGLRNRRIGVGFSGRRRRRGRYRNRRMMVGYIRRSRARRRGLRDIRRGALCCRELFRR